MEYTQLPFKFIIYNSNRTVRQNLFLSTNDYFTLIKNSGDVVKPYPMPDFRQDNYLFLDENYRVECLKNEEYRNSLRSELITELRDIVNKIVTTKLNPTTVDYFNQNIYDYKFYHKDLIDIWIEIWSNVKIEIESLETLLLFKKFLGRSCLNKDALEVDTFKRNKLWRESAREAREEESYWNDNYYEEGGGGQDWSDPF